MNNHFRDRPKIDPSQGMRLGDGTLNDGDRIEIGPTALAFEEWQNAGLALPDLTEMRKARHKRLTDAIVARNYGGLLMFDPLGDQTSINPHNCGLQLHQSSACAWLCASQSNPVMPTLHFAILQRLARLAQSQYGLHHLMFHRPDASPGLDRS